MSLPKVIKSDSESSAHSDSNGSQSSTELSEEEFEVEKLVGKRTEKGVLKYRVRWVGYGAKDDTWENVDNLNCPAKIAEYERELEQKKSAKRDSQSRTRTASRSSQYMDTSNENVIPKLSNASKRLKSITPSRTVKAEVVPSPLNSKKVSVATINSNEATIGIVEGRPLNVPGSVADNVDHPVIPVIPADHQCFGNSPSILEFAKRAVIHNVNNQKMDKVFSKTWKMRCTQCTEKYTVNDSTVEYGYCILTVGASERHFMIKLNKCDGELFLIDSDKFKSACPKRYGFFVCITREFFDTLGDLNLAIEEQKDVVQKCFDNSLLKPYKENGTVDFSILQTCPSEIMKAVREIGRLFFLELQLAIGRYMCTVVDISELYKFVMDFYEKREKLYAIVRKEAVENIYETLFMSLISESAES